MWTLIGALIFFLHRAQSQKEVLLSLELTVDGRATKLVLEEGQAYIDAARLACASTEGDPSSTDNCVSGAVSIIVSEHLRQKEESRNTLASPGVALVRESLANYDPVAFTGSHPLHVDIELPLQTRRTVCDPIRCWELEDSPFNNHTLQLPAWIANTSAAAKEVALALDLWRAEDLALLEQRVALERTRKATPIDRRLRRSADQSAIVSFDAFYPPYFILHTESLYFDAQRVKVAGNFRPPADGQVCIAVNTIRPGEEQPALNANVAASSEACFFDSYNAQLAGFSEARGTHRLTVRLKSNLDGGPTVGEGDTSSFVAAPPLRPTTDSKFLRLLRNAVVGWLYLDGAGDDPGAAGPLAPGWSGHTMVGIHKLNWIQAMIEGLLSDKVPGDLVECGAWRGGASIFMKGVLDAIEPDSKRAVLVADTFSGFPPAEDEVDTNGWALQNFGVAGAAAGVRDTFKRYDLYDDRVHILEGYFNETLPYAPTSSIAFLRLDCDMYRSTLDALNSLYDKVSPGGIVVHNNWQYTSARAAFIDFRRERNLEYMPLHLVDGNAMAFIKEV